MTRYHYGEVHAVTNDLTQETHIALVGDHPTANAYGPHFIYSHGGWDFPDDVKSRRLAVIDPEGADVAELAGLFCEVPNKGWIDAMRDALRTYAAPHAPVVPEPTGLGAVVEDEDGYAWVLANPHHDRRWYRCGKPGAARCLGTWDDIASPKVISEGVTD